ncbi:hypothetical protein J4E91_002306 [Alternaria rosae]|nr:hypothetical protein J4E91_002306 [Alternaria rosae]
MLSISWIGSFLINHEEYVEAQEPKNYILRSRKKKPSSEELGTEYDVPTLKFARIMLGDMIPDILSSDDSPCDAILQPYILQTHLHGQNLCRIWNSLTFSHKKSAMYIVVGLMKQLQTIQYPKAGLIAAANRLVHAPGRIALEVHTFTTSHGPAPVLARAANSPPVSVTTRQFLLDQSRRWQLLERYGVDSNETIWNCFDIITQFLYDMDFIPDDDKFYFCHLDLYARNLLVVVEHDSSLSLTGLLDWDAQFAHSCPKFVAYRASFWLLVPSGNGYNEMKVADKPKDADYRRLKSLWEEAASDEWRQYAYKSEYMIARRLFALLRDSIHHDGDKEEARSIIDEWQKLYNDQRLAAAYANDEIHTNDGDPAAG